MARLLRVNERPPKIVRRVERHLARLAPRRRPNPDGTRPIISRRPSSPERAGFAASSTDDRGSPFLLNEASRYSRDAGC